MTTAQDEFGGGVWLGSKPIRAEMLGHKFARVSTGEKIQRDSVGAVVDG